MGSAARGLRAAIAGPISSGTRILSAAVVARRRSTASLLAAASCLAPTVLGCGEPDPRQLIQEMQEAVRVAETVRYRMRVSSRGDRTAEQSALTGSVTLRRLDLSGRRFLARLEADVERPDGSRDRVTGVRSEEVVLLIRDSDRLARRSSIYEAGSSLLALMDPAFLYVFYDPESLRDEIEAESVIWEGRDEVEGEPCDVVRVSWPDDDEDARWCIGDDRLPRRLEWIGSDGASVLEAFDLDSSPEIDPAAFAPTVPEGYAVEELRYGPEPGTEATAEPMRTPDGDAVALADLAGEVLVLDFWASWCSPCLGSLAGLDRLIDDYAGRPVRFLAVNAQEEPSVDAAAFHAEQGLRSELLIDGDAVHVFYVRGSLPGAAVLDAEGRLVGVSIGYHGEGSGRRLASLVDEALASREAGR